MCTVHTDGIVIRGIGTVCVTAGPAVQLRGMSRYILGIEVLEPGCRKLRVSPHLGDLDWVEGYWPTPYGEVYVKAMRTDGGKTAVEIRVPDGIAVETEVD